MSTPKFYIKRILLLALGILLAAGTFSAAPAAAEGSSQTLHAFYPSKAVFSGQMQKYISGLDSLSFAWARMDAAAPELVNTEKGLNANNSFYYPEDFLEPVRYAKNLGKPVQLSIYMTGADCTLTLPYTEKRALMVQAVSDILNRDVSEGEGLFYDGAVIDFEGLRDTDSAGAPILYEGKQISTYFNSFLSELKTKLEPAGKKLYVAVNPRLYYNGYDYKSILTLADKVILMAHDYEPAEQLRKDQVLQYTGFDTLRPVNSPTPVRQVRKALADMAGAASGPAGLGKVWLQIAFDTAQWQYDAASPEDWTELDNSTLSREGRQTPLYSMIKDRVDNTDGFGTRLTPGYNNELQSPFIQYYNTNDKSWNVFLYEDSASIGAKMDLAGAYGLGGISLWSLGNVPDYADAKGKQFRLNGWDTILAKLHTPYIKPAGSNITVKFTNTLLEKTVRSYLEKPSGAVTEADLKAIYRLKLPAGIKSLKGIEKLTNLEYLDAQQCGISSIDSLAGLKNLRVLYLQRNTITGINPLAGLSKLEILSLNGNRVSDLKPLSGLVKLEKLYLRENRIRSLTPLSKLLSLKELYLKGNSVSDFKPVSRVYAKPDFLCDFQMK